MIPIHFFCVPISFSQLLAAHSGGSVLYLTLWDLETARVLRRFHHSLHQLEADYRIPSTWSASSDVFCLKTEANSAAILLKLNGRHALLHVDLATGTLRNGPICAMGVRQRLLSAESADIAVACAAGPEECLLHLRYPYVRILLCLIIFFFFFLKASFFDSLLFFFSRSLSVRTNG
jgi:hypothetical protein